jgi:hypothetical protein
MAQMRIFVSHSHEDDVFCRAIVVALRLAGADVWYDEHNPGTGQLLEEITRELRTRPVFIVILSKAGFASPWVAQECRWTFNLYTRERNRIILSVTAEQISPTDFDTLLYLEDFKRIEAPGMKPYPLNEALGRLLSALALTTPGEAPSSPTPQPSESVDDLVEIGEALVAIGGDRPDHPQPTQQADRPTHHALGLPVLRGPRPPHGRHAYRRPSARAAPDPAP